MSDHIKHPQTPPNLSTASWVWLKIGLLSFGGPAGQIALMQRLLIDEKQWLSETQFLHALNFCMLLPGPEAQQLATYIGWLLHGVRGGLVAGVLFILPGAIVMLGLSFAYVEFKSFGLTEALFVGVKAAVLMIVLQALLRLRRRVLKNRTMNLIAGAAFVGIFVFALPFPLIICVAAILGLISIRTSPRLFGSPSLDVSAPPHSFGPVPSMGRFIKVLTFGMLIWFAPIVVSGALLGPTHVFVAEGLFFSKLAVVTFGGAYAVLSYVAQQAVDVHQWLLAGEMVDGLGLAESTPGPLIMVVQFVGFLGAYRQPGTLESGTAALLASGITVWVTFVPCFIWIFLGAPYVERLQHNRYLSAALSCVTAAVVGVILNLAVWFALHVLFTRLEAKQVAGLELLVPDLSSTNWVAVLLTAVAGLAMFRFKLGLIWCIATCAGLAGAISAVG